MYIGDFKDWIESVGKERIFRMWVYKKMFTPYEQEEKFTDESVYEDITSTPVRIKEVVELPDKRIMIGVNTFIEDTDNENEYITYYTLDEIRLTYCADERRDE